MLRVKLRGRYEIIKELGSGGFSETYLARDLDFPGQPQCVVKQLKPQCEDDWSLQTARRLFDSEAAILSRLGSNEQIPQLMAYFEENQQFYLVQEFIEGNQLSEELDPERQWTEAQAISFLEDALGILEFIHRHDVVHRDLKPENIIRRAADRRLVFIDFGAIKEITGESAASGEEKLTIAVGTPAYMPIEQQSGKPRLNSDIYAIGLIAIQGLTGVSPKYLPEDSQTGEFLWRDLAQVSEILASLLDGMVRWNFRERYQSVAEVLEDLRQCQQLVAGSDPQAVAANPASSPAIAVAEEPAALDEVVYALEQHRECPRIRKLLFCAFAGYWENNSDLLDAYATDELLLALYRAHPTLTEFSDTLYAVVKTLNKQAKYFSVFNVLIHHISSLYQETPQPRENGTPVAAPSSSPSFSATSPSSSARGNSAPAPAGDSFQEFEPPVPSLEDLVELEQENLSVAAVTETHEESPANSEEEAVTYDPFEVRAEVIRYTTPLRAKIVLFSLLYFQFGYGGQDWSVLMTHDLDALIEKAIQEYESIDELEVRLHRIADGFGSERQAATQAATAIAQALRVAYDYR